MTGIKILSLQHRRICSFIYSYQCVISIQSGQWRLCAECRHRRLAEATMPRLFHCFEAPSGVYQFQFFLQLWYDVLIWLPFARYLTVTNDFWSSIPGNSVDNVQFFLNYLLATYQSPRMFRHPRTNGVVVSTFSGENSTFGQGSMEKGWAFVKSELNKIVPVRSHCWDFKNE